jgi:single-strand DNA-binding protein
MSDINTTTLTGRLVRAPIMRTGTTGTVIGQFTLAANQHYKDKNGNRQEETAFVSCKAFGSWAKAIENCQRGDMLLVAGRLRTESWQRDDTHQSQLVLLCESVFRGAPNKNPSRFQIAEPTKPGANAGLQSKDEIPF